MIKELKRMVYTIILVYVALVALLYYAQRSVMYFPDKSRPDPVEYGVSDMNVIPVTTEDNLQIEGWFKAPRDEGKPVIVVFHGNADHHGFRSFKARIFLDAGYGVMLAGYRGYGGNPGSPSEQGLYADARAQITWLLETAGVYEKDIVLYGESLGSGVATQMSTEFPAVKALILETPFNSTVDVAKWRFFFIPVGLLMKDRYESDQKIGDFTAPVFIMHGTNDKIVPYRYGQRLFEAADQPKFFKTFQGGGHNNLYDLGAAEAVLEFLGEL